MFQDSALFSIAIWLLVPLLSCSVGARGDCAVQGSHANYTEEVLYSSAGAVWNMAVDYKNNVLYLRKYRSGPARYQNGKIDLSTKVYTDIKELQGRCEFTVDPSRHQVYAGCDRQGLFKYDNSVGKFVLIGERDRRVSLVFYKDVLYYSLEDSSVYIFVGGHRITALYNVTESALQYFVIDKDNDRLYTARNTIYHQRSRSSTIVKYPNIVGITAITVDAMGEVSVCEYNRISRVDKDDERLVETVPVGYCSSLVFDGDNNPIYADRGRDEIIRLRQC